MLPETFTIPAQYITLELSLDLAERVHMPTQPTRSQCGGQWRWRWRRRQLRTPPLYIHI